MEGLWDRVSPYLHIHIAGMTDHAAMLRNHKGMLDGIKDKDPEKTWKWLRKDLIEAATFVMESIQRV